jgi:hypothetical protein
MAERIVTCDIQMDTEIPRVLSCIPRKCSVCVRPLWHGRCQTDNPFPPNTRCSMSRSFSEVAAMILLGSSGRSCGTGGRKTESLTYSHGVRSGDLGGQRNSAWSFAPVAAIFTQPAPLAATHEIKRTRHMQINLGKFLFLYVGRMLKTFSPFMYKDFVNCVRELWIILYYFIHIQLRFRWPVSCLLSFNSCRDTTQHECGS